MTRIIHTGDMTMNSSITALQQWANSLQPNQQYKPVDLLAGGSCAPPRECGIEVAIDATKEVVRIFRGEHGAFIRTLNPWGANEFRLLGLDVLDAIREVCRVGYPSWKASMDERKTYLLALLTDAEPVTVPAAPPMSRAELEQFIDVDPACQRAIRAFTESVNASGAVVTDGALRDFIQRSSTDPDGAILYYRNLRDGRLGVTTAPVPSAEKSGRRKVGTPAAVEV